MEFDIKQFEGLPDSWRFWPCKYKAAIGDPYANPLPIEAALKKAKALKATGIGVVLPDQLALDLDGFNSDKTFERNVGATVDKLPKSVAATSGRPNRKQIFFNIPPQWKGLVEKQVFTLKGCGKVEFRTGRHYSLIAGIHPQDQIEIIQQELFTLNPTYVKGYKEGGFAKGSAEGSVIKMKPMRMKSGGAAKRGYGKARR